ncbi:MAG: hypothetical protein J6M60_02030 [Clostridia bacterium]|nr:hypothetical protein [Clostridia bacterium]
MKNRFEIYVKNSIIVEVAKICESRKALVYSAYKKGDIMKREKYQNPVIPKGYKYLEGEWQNGFVIQRISDKSELVWVPVGALVPNGTLDGKSFSEKFGLRIYQKFENVSEEGFNEDLNEEFVLQARSVEKYGGFYISRFNISKNERGEPQSLKGFEPWTWIRFKEAQKVVSTFENSEKLKSHLVYGVEYDSVLEWLIVSGAKKKEEIIKNSSSWGNYYNLKEKNFLKKTGASELWCANNIYDLAGNVDEWTQELFGARYISVRGASFEDPGNISCSSRQEISPELSSGSTGFRLSLYIR